MRISRRESLRLTAPQTTSQLVLGQKRASSDRPSTSRAYLIYKFHLIDVHHAHH